MSSQPIIISYLMLRRLIGIVALLHPAILYLGGLLVFSIGLQESMSHYYYTGMRDVFVGIDVATGVFLLCYRGYDFHDRAVGIVAGLAAIVVALVPISPIEGATPLQLKLGLVHTLAAVVFLASLAYFCLVLFVRRDTQKSISSRKKKQNIIYRICGINIILVIVLSALYFFVPSLKAWLYGSPFIFILEVVAFWSFGISWLVKGRAILAAKP